MSNVHGKEIPLQYVTVKVPGQKPRGSRTVPQTNPHNSSSVSSDGSGQLAFRTSTTTDLRKGEKVTLTGYEMLRDPSGGEENNNADNNVDKTMTVSTEKVSESTTPNVKKRHNHRRAKSNGVKSGSGNAGSGNSGLDGDDPDAGFEFHIVSLDNKQWHFEASCAEERDEWVMAIEQQILNSLQVLLQHNFILVCSYGVNIVNNYFNNLQTIRLSNVKLKI